MKIYLTFYFLLILGILNPCYASNNYVSNSGKNINAGLSVNSDFEYDDGTFENQQPTPDSAIRKGSLNVYPNPAKSFIVVDHKADATHYAIANIDGKIVKRGNFTSGKRIELGNIPNGIYVLKIFSKEQTETRKFLVER